MKVNEIYKSIQGETSFAGLPCTLIRLTGCNLRCKFCDTQYAYEKGEEKTIPEIIEIVRRNETSLVAITGGEPLLQDETYKLIDRLVTDNLKVILETNGSLRLDKVNKKVIKILDIKTPSSNESTKNLYANFNHLCPDDEIKFVVSDETDFNWALNVLRVHSLNEKYKINFSPAHKKIKPSDLACWILKSNKNFRLNLQIHKYIWKNTDERIWE